MLSYVSSVGCWPSSSSWAYQQSLKQMLGSWLGAHLVMYLYHPIPTSSIPVPGVFAHWKCTWRFQLQAQSSMLPEAKKTNVRQNRSTRAVDPGRYISSQWGFNSRAYNGAAPCWRVHQYGKWGTMTPGDIWDVGHIKVGQILQDGGPRSIAWTVAEKKSGWIRLGLW